MGGVSRVGGDVVTARPHAPRHLAVVRKRLATSLPRRRETGNKYQPSTCQRHPNNATDTRSPVRIGRLFVLYVNLDFSEWGDAFPNRLLGAATLDRLRHGAYRLTLEGESYRSPRPPCPSPENQPLPQEEKQGNNHPLRDPRAAPVSGSINPNIGGSIKAVSDRRHRRQQEEPEGSGAAETTCSPTTMTTATAGSRARKRGGTGLRLFVDRTKRTVTCGTPMEMGWSVSDRFSLFARRMRSSVAIRAAATRAAYDRR